MDITKLLSEIIDALEDVRGRDIRVYDTSEINNSFERAVVVSGTSNRQTRALASSVADAVRNARGRVRGIEGEETGNWVLVDCGAVVVHCMQPAARQYYNLDELWGPETLDIKAVMAMQPGQSVPGDITIDPQ